MNNKYQLPYIDVDQLKLEIAEAMRTALRALTHECGMSPADFIDCLMRRERNTPRLD